jgi:hypothetical protein
MVYIVDQNPELRHCRYRKNITPHPIDHRNPAQFPFKEHPEKNETKYKED